MRKLFLNVTSYIRNFDRHKPIVHREQWARQWALGVCATASISRHIGTHQERRPQPTSHHTMGKRQPLMDQIYIVNLLTWSKRNFIRNEEMMSDSQPDGLEFMEHRTRDSATRLGRKHGRRERGCPRTSRLEITLLSNAPFPPLDSESANRASLALRRPVILPRQPFGRGNLKPFKNPIETQKCIRWTVTIQGFTVEARTRSELDCCKARRAHAQVHRNRYRRQDVGCSPAFRFHLRHISLIYLQWHSSLNG